MMTLFLGEMIAAGAIFWFAGAVTSPMRLPFPMRALSVLAALFFTYVMFICVAKMGANEWVLSATPWGCLVLAVWGCVHAWRTDIEDMRAQALDLKAFPVKKSTATLS